jgi:uncharacterized protein (DUF2147 family)
MKKLYILAALMMATTSAHAGNSISFEIGGHKVHIETPRDCDSLSCLKISAPGLSGSDFGFKNSKSARNQDNDDAAPPAPKTVTAPVAPAPVPPAAVSSALPAAETIASAPVVPATKDTAMPFAPVTSAPPVASAPKPAAVAAAPASIASAPATPIGVWATEESKGMVRIEPCGENLCGVAAKTGEKILINMRPSEAKWTGRIHDPDSGRTYDSSMTMKGPNTLRVQGCAFGGMFCGGQTWTRIS